MKQYVHNLLLHGIGLPARRLQIGERYFWLEQEHFESILDYLVDRDDVVITLDDGNSSDLSIALPAFLQRGLKAMFFISIDLLNKPGYLSSSEVKFLTQSGMVVGSHGLRHVNWRRLCEDTLTYEICHSRYILEELIGCPITYVAIPSGQYNRRVLNVLQKSHFEKVFTVDGPWACTDNWLQPRYPIRRSDTTRTIRALLDKPRLSIGNALRAGKRLIKKARWK